MHPYRVARPLLYYSLKYTSPFVLFQLQCSLIAFRPCHLSTHFPSHVPHIVATGGKCRCIVRAFWLKANDTSCTIDARSSHPCRSRRPISSLDPSPSCLIRGESPHSCPPSLVTLLNIHDAMRMMSPAEKKYYPSGSAKKSNKTHHTSHPQ